jgi:hypothetical protein
VLSTATQLTGVVVRDGKIVSLVVVGNQPCEYDQAGK